MLCFHIFQMTVASTWTFPRYWSTGWTGNSLTICLAFPLPKVSLCHQTTMTTITTTKMGFSREDLDQLLAKLLSRLTNMNSEEMVHTNNIYYNSKDQGCDQKNMMEDGHVFLKSLFQGKEILAFVI